MRSTHVSEGTPPTKGGEGPCVQSGFADPLVAQSFSGWYRAPPARGSLRRPVDPAAKSRSSLLGGRFAETGGPWLNVNAAGPGALPLGFSRYIGRTYRHAREGGFEIEPPYRQRSHCVRLNSNRSERRAVSFVQGNRSRCPSLRQAARNSPW